MPSPLRDPSTASTRAALVSVASEAFATHGYAGAHLEDIVRSMGLTKGALYHHFASKSALFAAVCEWLEGRLLARVAEAIGGTEGAWPRTLAALDAYLDASAEPTYARVVLTEAPRVPGARSLDPAVGQGIVRDLLGQLVDEGWMPPVPLETAARVVRAALDEVARALAEAEDVEAARSEGRWAILAILEGLRAQGGLTPPAGRGIEGP